MNKLVIKKLFNVDLVTARAMAGKAIQTIVKTVSGSIVSITDALAKPFVSLTAAINPIQDLHGYDKPWPAGGGVNKLPLTNYNTSYFTVDADGYVTQNNPTSAPFAWDYSNSIFRVTLPAGTYTASFYAKTASTNSSSGMTVFKSNGEALDGIGNQAGKTSGHVNFTLTEETLVGVCVNVYDGIWQLQIESGSTSSTQYYPHTNICPISGRESVEVSHSGADTSDPTVYTIPLGQTVYGGTVDVTEGKLVVDRAMKVFSGDSSEGWYKSDYGYFMSSKINDAIDRNATSSDFQSNLFAYAAIVNNSSTLGACLIWGVVRVRLADMTISLGDWKAQLASNPMQVVYTLATPITIDLTPQQITTLLGTNNIWSDAGNVTVSYLAKKEN